MNRPHPDEFAPFYQTYIDLVEDDVLKTLEEQLHIFPHFVDSIDPAKADYAYAENKWTIKEVIGHVTDTERIMAYRLLRFSRKDKSPLAGFEENDYVLHSRFKLLSINELKEEFIAIRKSNLYLFRALSEEQLEMSGPANNSAVSVRALLFIMAGHVKHHQAIIRDRYLNPE